MEDFDTKQETLEADMAKTADIKNLEDQLLARAKLISEEEDQMKIQTKLSMTGSLFAEHTIELAEEERERKEKQYQLSQYVSWFFYVVGWGMSAVGLNGGRDMPEA